MSPRPPGGACQANRPHGVRLIRSYYGRPARAVGASVTASSEPDGAAESLEWGMGADTSATELQH
jgi:hypothetical protein